MAVGDVVETGPDATRFQPGDRVGSAWLHRACGRCEFCRADRENLCDNADFTGWTVDGGYAEYLLLPDAFAYPVPDGLPDEQAAPLLCAGIIGHRSYRAANVGPGGRLGLYGFGNAAHIAIQVAVHDGCEVYVFTRREEHRRLARELGAAWAGSADEDPPEGARMHGSVIFAPAGEIIPKALESLEKGGTVSLAGIYMTATPPLEYRRHLYGEKCLRSVANATRRDGEELLQLAAEIPIRTTVQTYPLERANEALLALKRSRVDGAAVLRIRT
jgi:propanol-preferring alcohol dehydrogenase